MYYVYCGNGCAYSNEMYHGRVANALNSARRQGSKYIQKSRPTGAIAISIRSKSSMHIFIRRKEASPIVLELLQK